MKISIHCKLFPPPHNTLTHQFLAACTKCFKFKTCSIHRPYSHIYDQVMMDTVNDHILDEEETRAAAVVADAENPTLKYISLQNSIPEN